MSKKAIWTVGIVVLIVIVIGVSIVFTNNAGKSTAVQVVTVQEGQIVREVFANGKLEAKVAKEHFAASSGIIEKVHVSKGASVKKGQELLTLATTDTQAQLKQERQQLELNEAEKQKFIKDDEKSRKQTFEDMKKEMSETGASTSRDALGDSSEADVRLFDLKMSHTRSRMEELQAKLEKSRLFADIDGVVTEVLVKEGQEVAQGTYAFKVTNVSQLQVKANMSENDVNLTKVGMAVEVTGEAFTTKYPGIITAISPVAVPSELDAKETVVEVTVDLKEQAEELRPGFKTTVQVTVQNAPRLLVPLTAVKREGQNAYVFRVADQKAVKTSIKVGEEDDEQIEVLEGLQANDSVISSPSPDMKDGTRVTTG
ncbi:efflux RND transporter periplasmic adaptor subunit [Paenibacillus puerhi]|uniref:efflux RND transporter periplasmic adaptor subunit n=1 Tax=Paenibacillus puerhi TaxID=2692622 RepID=UPI001359B9E0|nr:efflux RND transporter periplasmic adaptor subunit [Paenibacillus puerhi]